MSKFRFRVINLRKFIIVIFIFIFCGVTAFGLFQFDNYYLAVIRQYKYNFTTKSKTVSNLLASMDFVLPRAMVEKSEISFNSFLKDNYSKCFKFALGGSASLFDVYEEDQGEEKQDFYKTEEKLYPVVTADNSDSNTGKDNNIDINENEKADNNKDDKEAKIKKANEEVAKRTKALHSKSESALVNIPYKKEDSDISGDPNVEVKKDLVLDLPKGKPQILIVHTHSREGYESGGKGKVNYSDLSRTTDNRYNVVGVGEELAKELRGQGFGVIHYTGDSEGKRGVNGAYERARAIILKILKQYPSIQVILDLHRDAAYDVKKKVYYKFISNINGEKTAQIMFVVSTDYYRYKNNPPGNWRDWHNNLRFGAKLQQKMSSMYPGIMRGMNISKYTYNQDLRRNQILVEIGTNANTIDESINAAKYLGKGLASLLKN